MDSPLLKALMRRQEEEQEDDLYLNQHHISTRRNRQLEAAVNRGLAVVYLVDRTMGAAMMREEGVPPEVVSRVLQHPERRRATDWKR